MTRIYEIIEITAEAHSEAEATIRNLEDLRFLAVTRNFDHTLSIHFTGAQVGFNSIDVTFFLLTSGEAVPGDAKYIGPVPDAHNAAGLFYRIGD